MLQVDIIQPSNSDWCSIAVFIKNGGKWFCVDYRDLNKVTEDDMYPMTNLIAVLDKLSKAKCITKIDLKSAFIQVNLQKIEENIPLLASPGRVYINLNVYPSRSKARLRPSLD